MAGPNVEFSPFPTHLVFFVLIFPQWVAMQRHKYKLTKGGKKYGLPPEHEQKLSDLGFVWQVIKTPNRSGETKSWQERFEDLLKFKEINGHTVRYLLKTPPQRPANSVCLSYAFSSILAYI
mmetsp:Transcript_4547/g.12708  ORF Transcript_4547/g.12708 Transcript_4547/m.12708 type:complete len:121 (-) Transcript_4547:1344-1706(-)